MKFLAELIPDGIQMADEEILSSLQNPKIKQVIRLRDRRERDSTQLFLIEGFREITRAVDSNKKIDTLFYCPEFFLGANEQELIRKIRHQKGKIFRCTKAVFEKISYRDRPDGLIAIAPQTHRNLNDLEQLLQNQSEPFLIIAQAIEKPGNLGTILRSADAAGADALIVVDRCTDIFNPNVVRASVGTLFTVPVIESDSEQLLAWLKQKKIQILAATPKAEKEFTDVDLSKAVAIAVGAEQYGLTDDWICNSDINVSIPMKGIADSLNVAMAAALLLYEVQRQRKNR